MNITDLTYIKTNNKQGESGKLLELLKKAGKTQVYLSTILPGKSKGTHLHRKNTQRFICIQGEVKIIVNILNFDQHTYYLSSDKPQLLSIEPEVGILILNTGDKEAYLICMPDPAYNPNDKDERIDL